DCLVDSRLDLASRHTGHSRPPTVTVDAQRDDVTASEGDGTVELAMLGHVPDVGVAPPRWTTEDDQLATHRRQEPEENTQERRLARPVRTEHGHKLAAGELEGGAGPQRSLAVPGSQVAGCDRHVAHAA